jgi:hypothetical protein
MFSAFYRDFRSHKESNKTGFADNQIVSYTQSTTSVAFGFDFKLYALRLFANFCLSGLLFPNFITSLKKIGKYRFKIQTSNLKRGLVNSVRIIRLGDDEK